MAAEEILENAPLAQPFHHVVEPELEKTDFTRIVDRDERIEIATPHSLQTGPDRRERIGYRTRHGGHRRCADNESGDRHKHHRHER